MYHEIGIEERDIEGRRPLYYPGDRHRNHLILLHAWKWEYLTFPNRMPGLRVPGAYTIYYANIPLHPRKLDGPCHPLQYLSHTLISWRRCWVVCVLHSWWRAAHFRTKGDIRDKLLFYIFLDIHLIHRKSIPINCIVGCLSSHLVHIFSSLSIIDLFSHFLILSMDLIERVYVSGHIL